MTSNGDTYREFKVGTEKVRGLGSFHKTLSHNKFGEVDRRKDGKLIPKPLNGAGGLTEKINPYGAGEPFKAYITGRMRKKANFELNFPPQSRAS